MSTVLLPKLLGNVGRATPGAGPGRSLFLRPWLGGQLLPASVVQLVATAAQRFKVLVGIVRKVFVNVVNHETNGCPASLAGILAFLVVDTEGNGAGDRLVVHQDYPPGVVPGVFAAPPGICVSMPVYQERA